MKPPATVRRVIQTLAGQHPNADTELHYRNAFELLAATILSAQSTDERVNVVTPGLFERYPDAYALAAANPAELERQIVSTGFFRQKSKALIGMAQALVAEHGGEVPPDMEKLTALPGVGRKTANVVLGHALGVPGLPVDRHVLRVSNRIGIAESDDPVTVEAQLCAALPKEMWTLASDVQILHGRRICRPKPLCAECSVRDDCDYYRHVISREPLPKLTGKVPLTKGARSTKRPRAVPVAAAARDVKPARAAKGTTSTKSENAIRAPRTAATRSRAKRSS